MIKCILCNGIIEKISLYKIIYNHIFHKLLVHARVIFYFIFTFLFISSFIKEESIVAEECGQFDIKWPEKVVENGACFWPHLVVERVSIRTIELFIR